MTKPVSFEALDPEAGTSLTDQMRWLHEQVRLHCPQVNRVAIALYDSRLEMLKTYVNSSDVPHPLSLYERPLSSVPSLEELEQIVLRVQRLAESDPELKGRIKVTLNRARPGTPEVDARMDASPVFAGVTRHTYGPNGVQVFVETDLLAGGPLHAQEPGADDARIIELTRETRLAYIVTGEPEIDAESAAGLKGLTRILSQRTSIEAAEPAAVDPARDELALFPLLYWPVPPDHPELSPTTIQRVEAYLGQGGMILFDTRDGARLLPGQEGGGPGEQRLAQILHDVDLPPLVPVPADHVLTRSFYLLQDFPGRWAARGVPKTCCASRAGCSSEASRHPRCRSTGSVAWMPRRCASMSRRAPTSPSP